MKEQQEQHILPKGWVWTKIEDISLKIHYGYTASATQNNTGIKLLRITDIQDNNVKWENVPFCDIQSNDIKKFELKENDIVFARTGATVGKSFLIPKNIPKAVFASYLIRINLSKQVDSKYIYYFFQSANYWRQISSKAIGSGQPNVNANSLSNIILPLCSIDEQNKIVLKLEEVLSSLEKSKEQLDLSLNKLNIYKRTVFKSLLKSKSSSKSFIERNFEDCVVSYDNKRIPLSSSVRKGRSGQYRYYGATGVIDYIDNYIFDGKYLLLGEDGANLLSKIKDLSFIVEGQFWVNNHAHIFQVKEDILIEYLSFYFNSLDITEYVTGTAQPKLNQSNLNRIPILIPSIDKQLSIVQEMQRVLSILEETEKVITKGLTQIDLLKQTVLNRAFTGKLLEQDFNNESASILLEMIKSEKEEYLIKEKEKKNNSIKVKIMPEESKSILEILKENIEPISSKKLWLSSDKKEDIEEFYAELKKHIESGDIIELSRNGKESFLKLVDKS